MSPPVAPAFTMRPNHHSWSGAFHSILVRETHVIHWRPPVERRALLDAWRQLPAPPARPCSLAPLSSCPPLPGPSFYRPQSCLSRDLAALSAVVHRRARHAQQQAAALAPAAPGLDVLDLMAGSGIRSARYLLHADADSVLCNEGDRENAPSLQDNLSWAAAQAAAGAGVHSDSLNSWAWEAAGRRRRVDLVHEEAVR